MQRAVAIKKLAGMLGKTMGYRVDPDAPTAEERAEAREQYGELFRAKDAAEKAMTARKAALLQGDAQYQELQAAYRAARKAADTMSGRSYRFKFTVGKSNGMFFHVLAQGDSWEEVIEIVRRKG